MSVITEEVSLKDGVSGPAKAASQQLTALNKALTTAQDKLTVAKATGDIKAYKTASKDVMGLQSAISTLPPAAGDASLEMAEMTGGLSAVAEVAAGVVVAFGAVVVAGAAMAIKASEAKAKIASLFDALGEGKIKGSEAVDMLDKLGDQIGQTRDQLAPLAKSFLAMGVTGTEQLKSLTLAAASAGALAEGGAESFTKLYQQASAAAATGSKFTVPYKKLQTQLVGMGLNIDDLAASMGTTGEKLTKGLKAGTVSAKDFANALQDAATSKGAGPLAKAASSLTNVWAKFQENITKMFEDIDVGPFLEQVKSLFDIFGSAKPSGEALKSGIGGFFKQVFAVATQLVPLVKHFLLDLVIYGLKAYLALRPIEKWFVGLKQNKAVMAVVTQAFQGLKVAALLVVGAVVAVIAVFAGLVAISTAIGVALWAIVGSVIGFTVESIAKLGEWVTFAEDAAKNFVAGLVNGIASGASAVVDSVTGLASKAKNAFKGALGINSPSREMMKLGAFAGAGVAQGLDNSVGQVGDSAAGVGGAAFKGAAGAASGGGGKGGGANITVNVQIDGAGKSAMEITEEMISVCLERIALSQGY